MLWTIVKAAISAAVIVGVAEVSRRVPRLGALLLTLPLVSILAFITTWTNQHDLPVGRDCDIASVVSTFDRHLCDPCRIKRP